MRIWTSSALVALVLSGCTMIPGDPTPEAPVPDAIGERAADVEPVRLPGWEALFEDEQLQALVHAALQNNRNLRVALLDVEAARAQYRIERSSLAPSLNVYADGTRQRVPGELSTTGESVVTSQYSAGLGLASYELDLFGRLRSLNAAALETYLGTEEARRSAWITLVSEVANAYLTLLADQQNLAISEETLEAQQDSVDLVTRRVDAGLGSELDVRQAEIALETARANRVRYQRLVSEDRNALAVLVGGALPVVESRDLTESTVAVLAGVPAGLDSDVLLARPDIRQAEHALQAANANIGAARAAFFPRLSLTGTVGSASREFSGLFESGNDAWSFSPQISLPIFAGGRNSANLTVAEVRRDQRIADYEQTVQRAFQEVADAMAARTFLADQIQAQSALVAATERSLELAEVRYEGGVSDYLAVLDARRELLGSRQSLVSLRQQMLANRVTLYRALGGGEWADQPTVLGTVE
ncbi:efflux transporter outer membrane subunit [Marinimicrobium sp. ARAG 43.8]|uniref:efflux transporter outer membrane subunit n=1 Tax=Marinimicrobium sp. ARAG 43.8 TaxID=3418719 RepID=UPI003CED1DF6